MRDIRSFIVSPLAGLRAQLNSDPVAAKAKIAKHLCEIKLTLTDNAYKVEAAWALLGGNSDGAGGRS